MLIWGVAAMAGGGEVQGPTACISDRELIASCMSDPAFALTDREVPTPAQRAERVAVVVWRATVRQNPDLEQRCTEVGQSSAEVHVFHGARPLHHERLGWHPGGFPYASPVRVPLDADGGVTLTALRSPYWDHSTYGLRDVTVAIPPDPTRVRFQATLAVLPDSEPSTSEVRVEHPIDQVLGCDWRERKGGTSPSAE